jgi:hypothetical protein
MEVTGQPVTVLDHVVTHPANGATQFAVSLNGTLVYIPVNPGCTPVWSFGSIAPAHPFRSGFRRPPTSRSRFRRMGVSRPWTSTVPTRRSGCTSSLAVRSRGSLRTGTLLIPSGSERITLRSSPHGEGRPTCFGSPLTVSVNRSGSQPLIELRISDRGRQVMVRWRFRNRVRARASTFGYWRLRVLACRGLSCRHPSMSRSTVLARRPGACVYIE